MTAGRTPTDGRVAVVTGAFAGIGVGITRRLLAAGYRVLGVGRSRPDAATATGGGPSELVADITDPGAPTRIVARVLAEFGGLDVLVHCAGILGRGPVDTFAEADFRRVLEVNVLAPMRLTGAALPALRAAGDGRVVAVGSRSWLGMAEASSYSSSKGGLVGMVRSLALAEGPHGITANVVAPGYVATEMTSHMTGPAAPRIPVGRGGTPGDIARAVEFFASPEAGYVTGQTLLVCGGRGLIP